MIRPSLTISRVTRGRSRCGTRECAGSPVSEVAGIVAVLQGVPGGDQAEGEQPEGTVRLWICPTPMVCLASRRQTSMLQRAAFDQVADPALCMSVLSRASWYPVAGRTSRTPQRLGDSTSYRRRAPLDDGLRVAAQCPRRRTTSTPARTAPLPGPAEAGAPLHRAGLGQHLADQARRHEVRQDSQPQPLASRQATTRTPPIHGRIRHEAPVWIVVLGRPPPTEASSCKHPAGGTLYSDPPSRPWPAQTLNWRHWLMVMHEPPVAQQPPRSAG
jgi:hypothetical protein